MNLQIIVFKEIRTIIEVRGKKIRIVECVPPTEISNYRREGAEYMYFLLIYYRGFLMGLSV